MQTNFDYLRDRIGFECIDAGELNDKEIDLLGRFMELASNSYILIPWPESQELMEEEWFEKEAILDINSTIGNSSYFIPLKRIL